MKIIILLLPVSTLILSYFLLLNTKNVINKGDIAFIGFNSIENDSFSIMAMKPIQANSIVYFTDSEWNGKKFGHDETTMQWITGEKTIDAGTVINFSKNNNKPVATVGEIDALIKFSSKSDAIFAYVGKRRFPHRFLAAISNHKDAYGTLINTNLKEGATAITFPVGTFFAEMKTGLVHSHYDIILDNFNYKVSKHSY